MGTLRSKIYQEALVINGITLGSPSVMVYDNGTLRPQAVGDSAADLVFVWDDAMIPSGEIVNGQVVVDQVVE